MRPMDEEIIRELLGWVPPPGAPNYRRIQADGRSYLQIVLPMGGFPTYVCIPRTGRPDMSRPHGYDTFLDYLRVRLKEHVEKHGSDEGFVLSEEDLDEIRDEIMDFYRRRRFLLEAAAPAREFAVVVSDAQHALALMDMLDRYCMDRERVRNHRKYEPYIRCHMVQGQMLMLLQQRDYPAIARVVREGIASLEEFDRTHEAWEYADIDQSIYPRSLIGHLRQMVLELLRKGQQEAVETEQYETAGLLRDLIAEFQAESA